RQRGMWGTPAFLPDTSDAERGNDQNRRIKSIASKLAPTMAAAMRDRRSELARDPPVAELMRYFRESSVMPNEKHRFPL
ncbi:hypothetical protein, partial [Stutzerimonas nitrititolerans]|uniref:hypothetical protein n=1 Tax=Stutzerimonas nitrititolerans TaxID=2482751 RepID=UPI002899E966